ncbi:MAG: lytic transglycosylase domain-containing protein [Bacteroidota bacterium]
MKKIKPSKMAIYTIGNIILLLIVFSFCFFDSNNVQKKEQQQTEELEYTKIRTQGYRIYALEIPKYITFAGEEVPLEYFDVRESLDRELLVNTYWQSHTLLYLKRMSRYFPVIEKILKKHDVPDDFKYLAMVESDLKNVVSPSGATGIWQFMKGTAKDHKLTINREVDERYHLEKSTEAACEYFKSAYELFGNWTLVAASFNAGRSKISRRLKEQDVDSYYDLKLNSETARYVYRILAAKMIMQDPGNYGFYFRNIDLYPPLKAKEVKVNESIDDLVKFASHHNINYKILKIFNPWLRSNRLTVDQQPYRIKIPSEYFRNNVYE